MDSIVDRLTLIWDWSMGARWRSWMFHALITLVLAPVVGLVLWVVTAGAFALNLFVIVGAWAMFTFYVKREVEQMLQEKMAGFKADWVDHGGDVLASFLAACLVMILSGR